MKLILLDKNSETLDFGSFKCYKRVKKISVSKFKVRKKMINQICTEWNSGAGKKVSGSDFEKFITINWCTVFYVIPVPILS